MALGAVLIGATVVVIAVFIVLGIVFAVRKFMEGRK